MEQPTTVPTSESTPPQQATNPSANPTNGLAVASLVTGIISFLGGFFLVGGLFGIAAIVLGIIGLKRGGGKGLSIAGIILGALGIIGSILGILFWVLVFGKAAHDVSNNVNDFNQEQRAALTSQKEFTKGEAAQFGNIQVTATSVTRGYIPADSFFKPAEGKEFVVVGLTLKNTGTESEMISPYTFKLESGGVAYGPSFVTGPGTGLSSITLNPGASTSGEVVFEVDKTATDLRLTADDYAYNPDTYKSETVKYTLAL